MCLCFSLNDRKSFENLPHWIKELDNFDVSRDNMFLLGCKSDLDMEVATDEILLFAQQNGIEYHQTSSLLNEGVNEAFKSIMINCAQKEIKDSALKKEVPDGNANKLNTGNNQNPQRKTCC